MPENLNIININTVKLLTSLRGKERGEIAEVLIFSFFTEKNHSMQLKTVLENTDSYFSNLLKISPWKETYFICIFATEFCPPE